MQERGCCKVGRQRVEREFVRLFVCLGILLKKPVAGKVLEESINGRANRRVVCPTGSDDLPGLGCNARIALGLRPLAIHDGFSHWIRTLAMVEWPRGMDSTIQNLSKMSVSRGGERNLEH